jgi:hypothetical protein
MWFRVRGYDITLARPDDRKQVSADTAVAVRMQQTGRPSHIASVIVSKEAIQAKAVNRSIILGVVVEVLTCVQRWFGSPG